MVIEPGAVKTELAQSIDDPIQAERLSTWSDQIKFLEADDVAESIAYALTQGDHVNVDEILLTPI
jgi:clavulanate-9-aldehyde reductase